ncbi:translation elongation factor Ts [Mesoterricola sediminis]|uniref:Elongation factor Ts n=1 Tax=Mesoterricola sediminis TaxID=2927980 RepID=A0AA48GQG7_9BACT|nr:translation elongation factor Ts [Mesoterricola sediminis]BDU75702.1 elongation factor Ts [Mesoterricola sediminis]
MSYTAQDVKALRDKTGLGMMDCKKALEENGGDMEKAIDYLRKKGLAASAAKAGRIAAEGIVEAYIHPGGRVGVLIELNCETDFVARTENFQRLVREIAMHVAAHDPAPQFVGKDEVTADFLAKEKEIATAQAQATGKPAAVVEKIVEGKMNKIFEEVCLLEQKFIMNGDVTVAQHLATKTAEIGEKLSIRRFTKYVLGEGLEKRKDDFAAEVAAQAAAAQQ